MLLINNNRGRFAHCWAYVKCWVYFRARHYVTIVTMMYMTVARRDGVGDVTMMFAYWICRIYDPDLYRVVQTNVGHRDAVCNIIHVPERGQVCGSFVFSVLAEVIFAAKKEMQNVREFQNWIDNKNCEKWQRKCVATKINNTFVIWFVVSKQHYNVDKCTKLQFIHTLTAKCSE